MANTDFAEKEYPVLKDILVTNLASHFIALAQKGEDMENADVIAQVEQWRENLSPITEGSAGDFARKHGLIYDRSDWSVLANAVFEEMGFTQD